MVTRLLPYWPAIFMPLNTRAGVAHAPIEPGERCFLWFPWTRALTLEVVALHRPGEALALADRGDVDTLAGVEEVGAEHLAHFEAREVVDAQLGEMLHRRCVGLLQVTELGLREPLRQRGTEGELDRGVAVALRGLQLDDATRPGFDHRHRDDTVLVVPDLGHAELAPEDALWQPSVNVPVSHERSARQVPAER